MGWLVDRRKGGEGGMSNASLELNSESGGRVFALRPRYYNQSCLDCNELSFGLVSLLNPSSRSSPPVSPFIARRPNAQLFDFARLNGSELDPQQPSSTDVLELGLSPSLFRQLARSGSAWDECVAGSRDGGDRVGEFIRCSFLVLLFRGGLVRGGGRRIWGGGGLVGKREEWWRRKGTLHASLSEVRTSSGREGEALPSTMIRGVGS